MNTCVAFSQHPWRRNICRNCFNKQDSHYSHTTTNVEIHSSSNQNTINEIANGNTQDADGVVKNENGGFCVQIYCYTGQKRLGCVVEQLSKFANETGHDDMMMIQSQMKRSKIPSVSVARQSESENINKLSKNDVFIRENTALGKKQTNVVKNGLIGAPSSIKIGGIVTTSNNKSTLQNSLVSSVAKRSGIPKVSRKPIQCNETFRHGDTIANANTGIPRVSKKPLHCNDALPHEETIANANTGIPRVSKKSTYCNDALPHEETIVNCSSGIPRVSKKPLYCSDTLAHEEAVTNANTVIPRVAKKPAHCNETITNAETTHKTMSNANTGIPRVSKKPLLCKETSTFEESITNAKIPQETIANKRFRNEAIANDNMKSLHLDSEANSLDNETNSITDKNSDVGFRNSTGLTSFGFSKLPQKNSRYQFTTFNDVQIVKPKIQQSKNDGENYKRIRSFVKNEKFISRSESDAIDVKTTENHLRITDEINSNSNGKQSCFGYVKSTKVDDVTESVDEMNGKLFETKSNSCYSEKGPVGNTLSLSEGAISMGKASPIRAPDGSKEKVPVIREGGKDKVPVIREGGKDKGNTRVPELIQIGRKETKKGTMFSSFKESTNSDECSPENSSYTENPTNIGCYNESTPFSMENLSEGDTDSKLKLDGCGRNDWRSVTGSLDRAINRKKCDKIKSIQNSVSLKCMSESKIPQCTKDLISVTKCVFDKNRSSFIRPKGFLGNENQGSKSIDFNISDHLKGDAEKSGLILQIAENESCIDYELIEPEVRNNIDSEIVDIMSQSSKRFHDIATSNRDIDKVGISDVAESKNAMKTTEAEADNVKVSSMKHNYDVESVKVSSNDSMKSDADNVKVSSTKSVKADVDSVKVSSTKTMEADSYKVKVSSTILTDEADIITLNDCEEERIKTENTGQKMLQTYCESRKFDSSDQGISSSSFLSTSEDRGIVIRTPMTSSYTGTLNVNESDFITIKDKLDSNNNDVDTNSRVKLGSFSSKKDSKFSGLSMKDVINTEIKPFQMIGEVREVLDKRIWLNGSPFDTVQCDKITESEGNLHYCDGGSSQKNVIKRHFGKNKSTKLLPTKSGKSKSKKKSKDVSKNEELSFGCVEMYSSEIIMPEEVVYKADYDLFVQNTSNHYKTIPEQENYISKFDSSGFNGEVNSEISSKFPECDKVEMAGEDLGKSFVVDNKQGSCSVSKPSAKIKPYTVVDLSTMSTLSPEEVDNCLEKVRQAETIQWLKYGQPCQDDDDDDEAPDNILPPKNFRKRSNTTDLIFNKDKKNTVSNTDYKMCAETTSSTDQIVNNISSYSKPESDGLKNVDDEMKNFRFRSKTVPAKSKLKSKAKHVAARMRASVSNSPENIEAKADSLAHSSCVHHTSLVDGNSKDTNNDPCSNSLLNKSQVDDDVTDSQEFPPLPSLEQLKTDEIEVERSSTPDWPPVPTLLSDVTNEDIEIENGNGEEAAADETVVRHVDDDDDRTGCESYKLKQEKSTEPGSEASVPGTEKEEVKHHDAHRSLPPIPVDENNPEVPLSWVTKAAFVGPGPYIPMCQRNSDDIPTAHFYDDIDNIRKILQERAMMMKRLQEEEEAEHGTMGTANVNQTRTSLGEMPDVIPNLGELNIGVEEIGEPGHDSKDISKKKKKKKSGKEKKAAKDEAAEDIKDLPVISTEKKTRSRFSKLIRKLSAPVKNSGDYSFVQRKATTPQPVRKGTFSKTDGNSRTEILATPSAGRRLFSLSLNRRHRERTTSDTEIMKSILDKDPMQDTKRGKHRTGTISFGIGRRKGRNPNQEQKAFSEDSRSIHSLEMMQLGNDFDSQSSCSARITPATSPLLLTKFNSVKKYKAPDPPNWKQNRTGSSSRSECSGSEKSFGHVPDPASFADDSELTNKSKETQGYYGNFPLSKAQVLKPAKPLRESFDNSDKCSLQESTTSDPITTDVQDDVFAENNYDNYPLSKQNVEKPTKPPRSESDDSETSKIKNRPSKPRRSSKEPEILSKPEPYSSQRIHRQIIGDKLDLNARFSPTLSNSEDETRSERSQYQVPYDNITNEHENSRNNSFKTTLDGGYENVSRSEELLGRYDNVIFRRPGSSVSEGNHREHIYDRVAENSPNILRFSIDSYDKLLEIHRETVQQIATATCFKCDCSRIDGTHWNDFKICGKMLNYGVGSYVTVPVSLKNNLRGNEAVYSAWLRQSFDFLQSDSQMEALDMPLCELSLHENLLHICKDIQRNKTGENEPESAVPQDIQVKRMLISKQTPKMSLSKYLSSTLDKHDKDPENYEKEACLILLQIFKGLRHILDRGYYIEDFGCDLVLLSDVSRVLLSSIGNNNDDERKGCPTALCLALPGLLKKQTMVKSQTSEVTSQYHEVKRQYAMVQNQNTVEEKDVPEIAAENHPVTQTNKPLVSSSQAKGQSHVEIKVQKSVDATDEANVDSDVTENNREQFSMNSVDLDHLPVQCCKDIVVLIFELFHSSQNFDKDAQYGLQDLITAELPIRSIYSKRMHFLINKIANQQTESVTILDLIKYMELIAFCPPLADNFGEDQTELLIRKWRNRRCVDIVTDILKKYSLVALANGLASGGKDKMGLTRDCVLECQFLANTSIADIKDIFSAL